MNNSEQNLFTTKLEVVIKDQKLIDVKTGNEIRLKDGTQFHLQVNPTQVMEVPEKSYEPKVVIPKDHRLHFKIRAHDFLLELKEDLKILDKGGKSKLANVKCTVIGMAKDGYEQAFKPIDAPSLNKAYTKTYNQFYKTGSNNRYAYDVFWYNGHPLKAYRASWERLLFTSEK